MRLYKELGELIDRDAIVIGDGGDFVSYAGRVIETYEPGCWMDPGPYGCLGSGPGYAIAASVARPDRRKVLDFLKEWGHRVKVHYLPKYAPDTNPIERVWLRLHEAVTRNHRCRTIDELLDLTFDWFETRTHFRVHTEGYAKAPLALSKACDKPRIQLRYSSIDALLFDEGRRIACHLNFRYFRSVTRLSFRISR